MTPTEVMDKLHLQSSGWLPQVKVVKPSRESAIIPDRRAALLKRIDDAQSEVGRISKLLNEIRADVLHLTTE